MLFLQGHFKSSSCITHLCYLTANSYFAGASMKKIILGISTLLFSFSVLATTAVLCGDAEDVDQNDKYASVHLILDRQESRKPNEISAAFYGKESKVEAVSEKQGFVFIKTLKPTQVIILNKKSVNYSSCDGESIFSIQVVKDGSTFMVDECRCFAD